MKSHKPQKNSNHAEIRANTRNKNRRIKDTTNPQTQERVTLLTKTQYLQLLRKSLKDH